MTEADRARAEALRRQKSIEPADAAEFSRSRSFNDADRTQPANGKEVSPSKDQFPSDTAAPSAVTAGSQPGHKQSVDKKVVVIGRFLLTYMQTKF